MDILITYSLTVILAFLLHLASMFSIMTFYLILGSRDSVDYYLDKKQGIFFYRFFNIIIKGVHEAKEVWKLDYIKWSDKIFIILYIIIGCITYLYLLPFIILIFVINMIYKKLQRLYIHLK